MRRARLFLRSAVQLTAATLIAAQASLAFADSEPPELWYRVAPPDQSDWSAKRVATFATAKEQIDDLPYAVLEIPTAAIEVAVYPEAVKGALERGAAWIAATAAPGTRGNAVIAGHRDGFFRSLEGIAVGTRIHLRTEAGEWEYAVSDVEIVDVLDVTPLEPSDEQMLTLITCFPFRYLGYAPDRYIVRAAVVQQ